MMPRLRRLAPAAMVVALAFPATSFTLNIFNVDMYRGHTRGFETSIVEIIAVAILVEAWLRKRHPFRGMGIALGAYALYCLSCMLGVGNAPQVGYASMALFKFSKAFLVFAAAFTAIENKDDFLLLAKAMVVALLIQVPFAIWQHYGLQQYRVQGLFPHPNSLGMWSYLLGLPLLGLAMSRRVDVVESLFYLAGTMAAISLVVLTYSRASIAGTGLGIAAVVAASIVLRPILKNIVILLGLLFSLVLILMFSTDSIVARFEQSEGKPGVEDFRSVLERQSAAMLDDHPLGVGWNNYCIMNSRPEPGVKYSRIIEVWQEDDLGHRVNPDTFRRNALVESIYWLHLAECGYPGLVAYLLFLLLSVVWTVRCSGRHRHNAFGGFAIGLLAAICLTYAHGTLERVMTQTKNLDTWLILLGLVCRIDYLRRFERRGSRPLTTQVFRGSQRPVPNYGPGGPPAESQGTLPGLERELP